MLVGFIEAGGGRVYAFEVSRTRASEAISLGLVARIDGAPMSAAELSRVARHALLQLARRSEARDRGIWPSDHLFTDIRSRIVAHTVRRRNAAVLADDLEFLAASLFEASAQEELLAAAG